MSADPRNDIYRDLQAQQRGEEAKTRSSATRVLSIIKQYIEVRSVLDIGCGLGSWLAAAQSLGTTEILGIEGPWLDRNALVVDLNLVQVHNLDQPISLGRRFDLVVCIEVGEHLKPEAAPNLVGSLVTHGDCILFSAAIPFQGGSDHLNEQFLDYWAALFAKHGFRPVDIVRGSIWNDDSMLWWLRQNCITFCSDRLIAENEKLKKEHAVNRPLSIVLPAIYQYRVAPNANWFLEYRQIMSLLNQGGQFTVEKLPNGQVKLGRMPK
jgi:SAM-dependent methyltransferase